MDQRMIAGMVIFLSNLVTEQKVMPVPKTFKERWFPNPLTEPWEPWVKQKLELVEVPATKALVTSEGLVMHPEFFEGFKAAYEAEQAKKEGKYQIEQQLHNGSWHNFLIDGENNPVTFETFEAAKEELDDHFSMMSEVGLYFNPDTYRIVKNGFDHYKASLAEQGGI